MMIQTIDTRKGYNLLVGKYLQKYAKEGDGFLKILCNVDVPVKIIYEAYQILVNCGAIADITNLDQQQKMDLYNRFLSLQTSVPREKKSVMCAVIHTLEFLKDNT